MGKPLVSVICLCYNHSRFVREAILSVVNQTYSPIEIIVADDCSTDDSQEIIKKLKEEFPALELLLSSVNVGNCKAFNDAFVRSHGSFIIDFATDDLMEPQRIEKQVAHFKQCSDQTGVVFTDATYIDANGAFIRNHCEHLLNHRLIAAIPQGDVYRQVLSTYFIASPTMMIKRNVLEALGGYDAALSYEDFDFWVRSARIFHYAFLNEKLTRIRKLSRSLSTGWYKRGDPQLLSTYKVCLKATLLNKDQQDKLALIQRVRYELRQSVFTSNHKEAKLFYGLLKQLEPLRKIEQALMYLGKFHLPLPLLRQVYYKWRYNS